MCRIQTRVYVLYCLETVFSDDISVAGLDNVMVAQWVEMWVTSSLPSEQTLEWRERERERERKTAACAFVTSPLIP